MTMRFNPDLRRARQLLPAGIPDGCRLVGTLFVDHRPGALLVTPSKCIAWMDGDLVRELGSDEVFRVVGKHALGV